MWSPEASPFVIDGPVPPDQLIGREAELEALVARAEAGRNVALVAPRRFGKTSLLGALAERVEASGEMACVRVDLYGVAGAADWVIRLERAWAAHAPGRLRDTAARILAGAQVGLSLAGAGFSLRLAERPDTDPLPALHAALDLPAQLAKRLGGRVLLVLDEFQDLFAVEGAEAILRSHAQHQRRAAAYVFAGSEPGMLAAAFANRARPFYAQAEQLRLGRLPAQALAEAVADAFVLTGRSAGDVLASLVAASQGHPQRAMLLAHLLWEQVGPGAVAGEEEWEACLAAALRVVDREATGIFDALSDSQRRTLRAVATVGSPYRMAAAARFDLPKASAQRALRHLRDRGLIDDDDSGPRVVDPLLARWLVGL